MLHFYFQQYFLINFSLLSSSVPWCLNERVDVAYAPNDVSVRTEFVPSKSNRVDNNREDRNKKEKNPEAIIRSRTISLTTSIQHNRQDAN